MAVPDSLTAAAALDTTIRAEWVPKVSSDKILTLEPFLVAFSGRLPRCLGAWMSPFWVVMPTWLWPWA